MAGEAGIEAAQVFYFADKALFKHQVETQGDVFMQAGAVFGNQGGGMQIKRERMGGWAAEVRTHRFAG